MLGMDWLEWSVGERARVVHHCEFQQTDVSEQHFWNPCALTYMMARWAPQPTKDTSSNTVPVGKAGAKGGPYLNCIRVLPQLGAERTPAGSASVQPRLFGWAGCSPQLSMHAASMQLGRWRRKSAQGHVAQQAEAGPYCRLWSMAWNWPGAKSTPAALGSIWYGLTGAEASSQPHVLAVTL